MVRPWLKRLGLWGLPTFLVILLWQIWDRHEETRLAEQVRRVQTNAPAAAVHSGETGAGRFYLSAYFLSQVPDGAYRDVALARDMVSRGEPLPDGLRTELASLSQRFEPAVRLVDQAAGLPLGSMTDVSYITRSLTYRQLDTAYSLVMVGQLAQGRTDEPAVGIVSRARVLRAYDWDPTWLMAANKAATAESIATDLGLVMDRAPLAFDRARAIDAALASVFQADELERTVRAQFLSQNLAIAQILKRPSDVTRVGVMARPLLREQAAVVLEAAVRCIEVARRPFPARILDMQRLEASHMLGEQVWIGSPAGGVEMCRRVAMAYARGEAGLRSARVALAIERYRLMHAELPTDLSKIDVDVNGMDFVDPFTAKPLFYRRQSEGFTVYSVGPDLRDGNGSVQPERLRPGATTTPPASDIGISVRRMGEQPHNR